MLKSMIMPALTSLPITQENNLAPIALFTYNRLAHTRSVIDALKANDFAGASNLIVFSDGAKTAEVLSAVLELRAYLVTISGFKSVTIIERKKNLGLANSVIDGVTTVCDRYGKVIVMEDDLVPSPYFLRYMNDALDVYFEDDRVISVHGYIYPIKETLPSTFFLRGADCWGWATWKRGWDLFETDAQKLYTEIQCGGEAEIFDFNGQYGYTEMLKQQTEGRINSWAIRWYASAFLAKKLTLYPGISLIQNIGNDDSGTHSRKTDIFDGVLGQQPVSVGAIPVVASVTAYAAVCRYFKSQRRSLLQRAGSRFARLLKRRVVA